MLFLEAFLFCYLSLIARKCLNCVFGTGAGDLNDAKLQAVVYEEVVIKLEELEVDMINRMYN